MFYQLFQNAKLGPVIRMYQIRIRLKDSLYSVYHFIQSLCQIDLSGNPVGAHPATTAQADPSECVPVV